MQINYISPSVQEVDALYSFISQRGIRYLLLTGVIGEALVHHDHVLLLRGQDGAPCRQQILTGRNPFDKALVKGIDKEQRVRRNGSLGAGASRSMGHFWHLTVTLTSRPS